MKPENYIGKRADIVNRKSIHYNSWGFIKSFDGRWYHITGGSIGDNDLVFQKDEFKIKKGCSQEKCQTVGFKCWECK